MEAQTTVTDTNERKFALGTNTEVKQRLLAASKLPENNVNAETYVKWYFDSFKGLIRHGYSEKHAKNLLYNVYEIGKEKFNTFMEYYSIEKNMLNEYLTDYDYEYIVKYYGFALDKENASEDEISSVIKKLYKDMDYRFGYKKADELLTPLYGLQERKFGSVKDKRELEQEEYIRSYEAEKIKYNNPPGFRKLDNHGADSDSAYVVNDFKTLLNDAMKLADEYYQTKSKDVCNKVIELRSLCQEYFPEHLSNFKEITDSIGNYGREVSEHYGVLSHMKSMGELSGII